MSQKFLLLVAVLFLFFIGMFLFWKNERALNPDDQKSWWVVAFVHPEDQSDLSFFIENHTPTHEFHYSVRTPARVLSEQNITLPSGTTETIPVAVPVDTPEEISVEVTHSSDTRILYR